MRFWLRLMLLTLVIVFVVLDLRAQRVPSAVPLPRQAKWSAQPLAAAPLSGTIGVPQWLRLPLLPSGRRAHAAEYFETQSNRWLFVFGGYNASFSPQATVYRYDILTGVWDSVTTIPSGPRVWGTAVRVKDKIYLVGGGTSTTQPTATIDVYDPAENSWQSAARIPDSVVANCAVAWRDSMIYVMGGSRVGNFNNYTAVVRRYNPSTNSWSVATSLITARRTFAAGIVGDTIVYAAGVGTSGVLNTAYKGVVSTTNPNIISWTQIANYPSSASRLSGGNIHDTVFIAFGEISGQPRSKKIYGYGWGTNTWIEYPDKPDTAISECVQLPAGSGLLFVPAGQYGLANSDISDLLHALVFDATLNVTSPNGGEIWQVGTQHQISWRQIGVPGLTLEYSTDNGTSWILIADNVPPFGSYLWTIPDAPTSFGRVRITSNSDSSLSDISDSTFGINRGGTPVTPLLVEGFNSGVFPPPGWLTINNDSSGIGSTGPWFLGTSVFDPFEGSGYVASNFLGANGPYLDDWIISPRIDNVGVSGSQDSLTFYTQSIEDTIPPIFPDSIEIRLSTSGTAVGDFRILLQYINVPKTGWTKFGYRLNDSLSQTSNIYLAFRHLHYDGGEFGHSSDYCGLDAVRITRYPPVVQSISVTSPNGGEVLMATLQSPIGWSQTNVDSVKLEYSTDGGTTWVIVAQSVSGASSPFTWTVPNTPSTRGRVRVSSTADSTISDVSDYFFTIEGSTGVQQVGKAIPETYALQQNYPNPFNPTTTIRFDLPKRSLVVLEIFDVLGREVATLLHEELPAGSWLTPWNASATATGVYFYRIIAQPLSSKESGTFVAVKKLLLLK